MALDEVASPPAMRFSTAGLPDAERIARWAGHKEQALIGLHCRMVSQSRLEATELNLQLRSVQLARVRGNAHLVGRPIEVIRRQPAEAIAVYAGAAFFYAEALRPAFTEILGAGETQ